jgi:hypothetical protein
MQIAVFLARARVKLNGKFGALVQRAKPTLPPQR